MCPIIRHGRQIFGQRISHPHFYFSSLSRSNRCNRQKFDSVTTGVDIIASDNYVDYADKLAVKLQKAILTLPPKQQLLLQQCLSSTYISQLQIRQRLRAIFRMLSKPSPNYPRATRLISWMCIRMMCSSTIKANIYIT